LSLDGCTVAGMLYCLKKISKSERLLAFACFKITSRIVGVSDCACYIIRIQSMNKPYLMDVVCVAAAGVCYAFLDLLLQYFNRRFDVNFHGSLHFSVVFLDF